jgi:hypothetical protein
MAADLQASLREMPGNNVSVPAERASSVALLQLATPTSRLRTAHEPVRGASSHRVQGSRSIHWCL